MDDGNGLCNCTIALAEHEQGPWTTVQNTNATSSIMNVAVTFNCKYLQVSCMPKPVSAGPYEPELSQRNAFGVLMTGSSRGKSLPSGRASRY